MGEFEGINRPDLQWTEGGVRYFMEFDRPLCSDQTKTLRGAAHASRIRTNARATAVVVILRIVGACE